MTRLEIYRRIKELNNVTEKFVDKIHKKAYNVRLKNGKLKKMKLFIADGEPCYIAKGKSNYGYVLTAHDGIEEWVSIDFPTKRTTEKEKFHKRLKRVIKLLEASGLWSELLTSFKAINDNYFDEVYNMLFKVYDKNEPHEAWSGNYNNYNKWFETHNLPHISCDMFHALNMDKGIKTFNLHSYEKERITNAILEHINEKTEYHYAWRKGYDNRLTLDLGKDGVMRGWYSEEYLNCGNGHYYIMLDANHALYCEDD